MFVRAGIFLLFIALATPVNGQGTRIALEPVVSGLSNPILLTNARDGSNRRFIVEQGGRILVLAPNSTTPTLFLDISSRVLSGGERGLLGLAFHPLFSTNGRYFVKYNRRPDGVSVIAEYRVGDPLERVLLTVSQPFDNHNGGMVEFGFDGFLYIATGDGGSGNDPGNRAQNIDELLGKILRIDVDRPQSATVLYSSPATNPFYGSIAGRDEIFAYGLRNPWRFSFDRSNGLLYAGDVGQGAIEEIDIVRNGGNYGWRILEGGRCTNLGPASCTVPGFIPPITEYANTGGSGRCSITGGYVYRGSRQSLPDGAYIFGDYCSGEIFMLKDGVQTVLLDTSLNISSFGEDESGELYVVGLGGSVQRIGSSGVTGVSTTGFSVPALGYTSLTADAGSAALTVGYTRIQAAGGSPLPAGMSVFAFRPAGILVSETTVPASPLISSGRIYAEVGFAVNTGVAIANPNSQPVTVSFYFTDADGATFAPGSASIPAGAQIAAFLNESPFNLGASMVGTFTFETSALVSVAALRGFTNERGEFLMTTLPVADLTAAISQPLTFPHFADGGGWRTQVVLVNPGGIALSGSAEFRSSAGQLLDTVAYTIPPNSSTRIQTAGALSSTQVGYVRVIPASGTQTPSGSTIFSFRTAGVTITEAGVPALRSGRAFRTFVETAGNFAAASEDSIQAGLAIANTTAAPATVTLALAGVTTTLSLPANGQTVLFLNQIPGFGSLPLALKGVLRISSTSDISVISLRARYNERRDFLITTSTPSDEAASVSSSELLFPHFVRGGNYSTQFVLFGQGIGGTMYFFNQAGQAPGLILR
jgi:glucose/arabinose dehydrogenase